LNNCFERLMSEQSRSEDVRRKPTKGQRTSGEIERKPTSAQNWNEDVRRTSGEIE
jgi:hypothetical protein